MKRLFVSQMLPQEIIQEFQVSQAGNNFCRKLVSYGLFTDVLSIPPVNIKDVVRSSETSIYLIQRRCFPHFGVLRILNVVLENLAAFRLIRKTFKIEDNIWFYNLTISNCLLFLLLKIVRRSVFIIVADYQPQFQPISISRIVDSFLGMSSGIISLSPNLKKRFPKNIEVLSGIVDETEPAIIEGEGRDPDRNVFFYSGALEDYCGISLALEVFKDFPRAELLISGRGSNGDKVIDYCRGYSNIQYLGFLNYHEYLQILRSVTFCLSLRNPHFPFNQYNFPSKIVEYCQLGKVVISTMEYDSFPGGVLLQANFDSSSLRNVIEECLGMESSAIRLRSEEGRRCVLSSFGKDSWLHIISRIEQDGRR